MAEYLVLAENVIFKNEKLTCINIYDRFTTVAMPAEFKFDLAVMCGPDWSVGEHKLSIKVKASNGKEISIGELAVNIPNKDFVYHAFANDCKIIADYSVTSLTFLVYDNDKEIISKKYPVISMLVPQKKEIKKEDKAASAKAEKKVKEVDKNTVKKIKK